MKDKRDRKEFPYPEHINSSGLKLNRKPLCGTLEINPIVIRNTSANPPEAICPKCRRVLAKIAKEDWNEFLRIMEG